jgi:pectinesterase
MRVAGIFGVLFLTILAVSTPVSSGQRQPVTIFLAGDSTMAEKRPDKRPETGWGEMLGKHFQDGKVIIDNCAQNGRSTRTFISEGRWQAIIDALKPGDYVIIQFGHNDESKQKGERYTPPADFRSNLIKFVQETRARRATPFLLTPVMRRRFDKEGRVQDTHGEYPDIVRSVAKEFKVSLIDMHRLSTEVLTRYGAEGSRKLFLQLKAGDDPNYPNGIEDNTHFNPAGAEVMAQLAADAMRAQHKPLAKFMKPRGASSEVAR